MKNEEILKKAIEKAVKNGYFIPQTDKMLVGQFSRIYGKKTVQGWYFASIIYSHDFAKAFWGEEKLCGICLQPFDCGYDHEENFESGEKNYFIQWQYHLKEMVISENPIKYLEQFI